MNASQILEQAKVIYVAHAACHRDKMLEVGRLLSRYVAACISEGGRRDLAIKGIVESLGVSPQYIRQLVTSAMAVDLLGDGQPLGQLPHGSLRVFDVFLRRVGDKHGQNASETWDVKPEYAKTAKVLFDQVVAEQLTERQAFAAAKIVFVPPACERRAKIPPAAQECLGQVVKTMRRASPGDVAETCMALVKSSEHPQAVALKLTAMLERWLPTSRAKSLNCA